MHMYFLNKTMREDTEKLQTCAIIRRGLFSTPYYNRFCDIIYFKKLIRFVFLYIYILLTHVHIFFFILYDIMFLKRRSPDVYKTTGVPYTSTHTHAHTYTPTYTYINPYIRTQIHTYRDTHTYVQQTSSDTIGLAYSSYVNVRPMINRILIYSRICCCSRMSNSVGSHI